MPIFQDDLESQHPCAGSALSPRPIPIEEPSFNSRNFSEESLPTALCEGPISDSPRRPYTLKSDDDAATGCRAELIERLKRGESPSWIVNRHLESIFQRCESSCSGLRTLPVSPQLLPSLPILPEEATRRTKTPVEESLREGLGIERPKSALHSGDFTNSQEEQQRRPIRDCDRAGGQLASATPWLATSPPRDFAPFRYESNIPFLGDTESFRSATASSPLSSSFSSSFVYHPPTSPLVQSESNDEVGFAMGPRGVDLSSREFNRRLQALGSIPSTSCASPPPRPAAGSIRLSGRRDREPYQAHQPRRSLTSTPSFALSGTSPHQSTAMCRTRRPSLGSDSSPMQHASMVGSYEESILRGRMSTTPSKPFDFLAQIGVLGIGKCKPSLRCPAHVTLPFPAVYYSYSSTSHSRSVSNDGPSPYVGQIDLENGLPSVEEESRSKRKAHGRYMNRKSTDNNHDDMPMPDLEFEDRPRPPPRPKRRTGSCRAPPGGSYRIPERGQIQIIIKNQNKTAVKLFLMPYDLAGMEPGTKTFIRQRSYSAGPIIDSVPNPSKTDAKSRPMLRYLVHLHICCPSKGRFYLYKSIRVVFANRVPEGKEKLQNETTWPEPRFAPYKPIRVMHPPLSATSGPGAMLALDKAFRRRSLGVCFGAASSRAFDMVDGLDPAVAVAVSAGAGNTLLVDPIPFRLPRQNLPRESDASDSAGLWSPDSFQAPSRPSTQGSTSMAVSGGISSSSSSYEKLNKGDSGYGGHAFSTHFPAGSNGLSGAEGLLSQRLRSMGVHKPPPPQSAEDLA
ncbi:hypothetical protein E4U21_004283 [Claviceps maximensis]|nr:hypothetical protein E4U21_004283 [Claviceps maximensis]